MTIQEEIIKKFKESGMTVYQLFKETDISQSNLHRYFRNEAGMGSKNVEKLRIFFKMVKKIKNKFRVNIHENSDLLS